MRHARIFSCCAQGSRPFLSRCGWGCSRITFWLSVQMEKRGQKQEDDAVFSDHMFYLSSLSGYITKPVDSAWQWRMLDPEQFSAGQGLTVLTLTNTEEFTSLFHSTWQNILDSVAPFKVMRSEPKAEPGWTTLLVLSDESAGELNVSGRKTSCRELSVLKTQNMLLL